MSDFFSELRRNELKYSQQSERLALASNIQIESPQMLENVNIWNGTTCTTCTTCPSRLLAAPEWLLEVHFTCVPSWWWRCMYSEISRDPLEIDLEQLPTKVRQATRMRGCLNAPPYPCWVGRLQDFLQQWIGLELFFFVGLFAFRSVEIN